MWYMAYSDAAGKRHFPSSGILHSPRGPNGKVDKVKAKQNKREAMIQANRKEQIAQGNQRLSLMRKHCASLLAQARDNEAQQSGMTISAFFDSWAEEKFDDVSSSYAKSIRRYKNEFYESLDGGSSLPIVDADEEDIENFVDTLIEKKLSATSINKRLDVLKEMFNDAQRDAFVIETPVTSEHYQEESPIEKLPLGPDHNNRILTATRIVDWHTTTLFGAYVGMRLNDARGQIWDAVDWERRIILWVPMKTRRVRRRKAKIMRTPLHPVLFKHLLRVRQMCGDSQYITPGLAERPISNLSEEFVQIIRDAEIDPIELPQPNGRTICALTFHSERHGFATLLKRVGAPDKEWSRLTGHSVAFSRWCNEPISKIAQLYNHVDVEDLRKWIDLLPSVEVPSNSSTL